MDNKGVVKEMFRNYIEETFHEKAEKLKIYIYGLQLQICGGILKFEEELDFTIILSDLGYIARYRGIGAGKDFLFYKERTFGKDVL